MPDASLAALLRAKRIKFQLPKDFESSFNLLLLHQARARATNQKQVDLSMLPGVFDLIVWYNGPVGEYDRDAGVLHPGSTIVTSSNSQEVKRKACWELEVTPNGYSLEEIPLRTPRALVIKEVDFRADGPLTHVLSAGEMEEVLIETLDQTE